MRKLLAAVVCAMPAVLSAFPLAGRAQTTQPVGLEMGPAHVEQDLSGRSFSTTLLLVNHDPVTYDITLSLAALGHDLDGAPQYPPSSLVTKQVALGATSFSLKRDQRKHVSLSGSIPSDARSIYFGVIAEYKRAGQTAGTTVETRTRVASQFLLRGPKPWNERVVISDVGALQGPGSKVTLYAIAKNTGNVHVRPTGTISVRAQGRKYVELPFALNAAGKGGAIIPGFARKLTALWTPPSGFTGSFTVTGTTKNPSASLSKKVSFAKGRALTPDAKIKSLSAGNDNNSLIANAVVTNEGGAALVDAKLTITATQDGRFERGRQVFPVASLGPGASLERRWIAGRLSFGAYQITATLEQGTTLLDQRIAGVRLGADLATKRGIWIWVAAGLLVLLLLLLIAYLTYRAGRRAATSGSAAP